MKEIKIEKSFSCGLHIVSMPRSFGTEYFITATPEPGEPPWRMFERITEYLNTNNAKIISQDVFGLPDCRSLKDLNKHQRPDSEVKWPITWLENRKGSDLSGTYVWAISGTDVKPIHLHDRIVGNVLEDEFVRFIRLGGLTANRTRQTPQQQTQEVMELMDTALEMGKMDFSSVIRTWFYNKNITSWYREFNLARDEFFHQQNVFNKLVPASTAVGTHNCTDAALIGATLAIQCKSEESQVLALTSPLQGPALEYGSSFSRAIELVLPDHRRLYLSGTASIESTGKTIHLNNTPGQVKQTMEVTYAILKSQGMNFTNVTRSIGYFKNAEEAKLLGEYCRTNKLPRFPIIVSENDICRDDLLFEIELDAIK